MTSLKFTQGTGWPSGWLDTTKMSDGFILDLIILLIVGGLCSHVCFPLGCIYMHYIFHMDCIGMCLIASDCRWLLVSRPMGFICMPHGLCDCIIVRVGYAYDADHVDHVFVDER